MRSCRKVSHYVACIFVSHFVSFSVYGSVLPARPCFYSSIHFRSSTASPVFFHPSFLFLYRHAASFSLPCILLRGWFLCYRFIIFLFGLIVSYLTIWLFRLVGSSRCCRQLGYCHIHKCSAANLDNCWRKGKSFPRSPSGWHAAADLWKCATSIRLCP